jgi:hypothetical protein
MENLPSLSTSHPTLKKGDSVVCLPRIYNGRRAQVSREAIPALDGTPRYYVSFIGSHSELIFRIDELQQVK